MPPLGAFHLATAILAIVAGALVLVSTKGTRRHRQIGWVYVASMLALNGSALMIYRLFGRFGPFHAFALASLLTVAAGTLAAVRARGARKAKDPARRATLIEKHYAFMTWSYVGLLAAAVSEVATRVPAFRPSGNGWVFFTIAVVVSTLGVVVVGARLIRRHRGDVLARFAPRAIVE